jgi:hypothetical protein
MAIVMGVVPGLFLRPMEPAVTKTVQAIVGSPGPANTAARHAAPEAGEGPADAARPAAAGAPVETGRGR